MMLTCMTQHDPSHFRQFSTAVLAFRAKMLQLYTGATCASARPMCTHHGMALTPAGLSRWVLSADTLLRTETPALPLVRPCLGDSLPCMHDRLLPMSPCLPGRRSTQPQGTLVPRRASGTWSSPLAQSGTTIHPSLRHSLECTGPSTSSTPHYPTGDC